MCNQAVSLIAAEIERQGITTVCIVLLRDVAEKVRPPRALFVPFGMAIRSIDRMMPRGSGRWWRGRWGWRRMEMASRRCWSISNP
jgi:hypothetical protein